MAKTRSLPFEVARVRGLTIVDDHPGDRLAIHDAWLLRVYQDRELPTGGAVPKVAWYLSKQVNYIKSDERQGTAWPAHDDIAEQCGVSERQVRYAIEALKKRHHIVVEHRRHRGNRYALILPDWPQTKRQPTAVNEKRQPTAVIENDDKPKRQPIASSNGNGASPKRQPIAVHKSKPVYDKSIECARARDQEAARAPLEDTQQPPAETIGTEGQQEEREADTIAIRADKLKRMSRTHSQFDRAIAREPELFVRLAIMEFERGSTMTRPEITQAMFEASMRETA